MLNYFSLFIILFFAYLNFGLFFVRLIKIKFTILEKLLLSLVLGIVLNVSLIVGLGHLFGPLAYYCLITSGLFGFWTMIREQTFYQSIVNKIKQEPYFCAFLVFCIVLLASGLMFSGRIKDGFIYLQDLYDTSWHMALQKELLRAYPPRHPSNPQLFLMNYHYFYDVFIASFAKLTSLSLIVLNYRFSQFLIASLLILTAYAFGKRFKNRSLGIILTLLITFAGNFGYLIPFFLADRTWSESSFWVSQTFSMLVNPQLIFSFATLFLVLLLMTNDFRNYSARHYLLIPLIATSIGFKTYGWIIMSFLYAISLLLEILTKRKLKNFLIGLFYIVLTLPFFYLITGFASGSFFWQPLWFLDSMVEAPDRVNNIRWRFLLDHYRFKKDNLRIIWLRVKELFIFYFGNLGIRSFFITLPLFSRKAYFKKQSQLIILIFLGFIFSSIFPLLFLQTGRIWNSIQFWYYALIFADILVALLIEKIISSLKITGKVAFISFLSILTIPAFFKTMSGKWRNFNHFEINKWSYLQSLNQADRLLICPENTLYFRSSFINAHTPATVFLSDEEQLELVVAELDSITNLASIFKQQRLNEFSELLDKEKINHILCSDSDYIKFINQLYAEQEQKINDWSVYALE